MKLVLGNRDAVQSRDDGETFERMPKGKRATVVDFEDGTDVAEALRIVTDPEGVWAKHADDGAVPAWIASDNSLLAAVLADRFTAAGEKPVEVRELLDPYDVETPKLPTVVVKAFGAQLVVMLLLMFVGRIMLLLKTNAGNDFQAAQMGGAASATNVAKYVAITANTTAPAAGDTTLTGEITTAGGGLVRKAGTYAHTTGAASYTITTVFTANGSDSLPVTIGKRGIFDQASGGQLVFSTLVSPTATLSASGDVLTITDTVSL